MHKKRIINQLIKLAMTGQSAKIVVDHMPSTLNTSNVICNDSPPEAYVAAAPDFVDLSSIGAGIIAKTNAAVAPIADKVKIVLNTAAPAAGIVGGGLGTTLGVKQVADGIKKDNIEDICMGVVNTGAGIGTLVGGASSLAGSSLVPALLAAPAVTAGSAIAGTLGASAAATNAVTHAFGVPIANAKLEDYLKCIAKEDGTYDADKTYNNLLWNTTTTFHHVCDQLGGIITAPSQIIKRLTSDKPETQQERAERLAKHREEKEDREYEKAHGREAADIRAAAKIEKEFYENPEVHGPVLQQIPYSGLGSVNIYPVF